MRFCPMAIISIMIIYIMCEIISLRIIYPIMILYRKAIYNIMARTGLSEDKLKIRYNDYL